MTEKTTSSQEGWFVYIVRCADGSLYTGITNGLEPTPRWEYRGPTQPR
ncbi:MAG TPA: hypothetical protein QF564_09190 [Pirellulaceae bacterium]|nr:hypothetical protein [Pirellulaceae bacterium]